MPKRKDLKVNKQPNQLRIGTVVHSKRLNQDAVITQVFSQNTYQIEVLSNGLRLTEKSDYLEVLTARVESQHTPLLKTDFKAFNAASAELDLHGMRYESALSQLAQFLDQAIINHYSYIRVNHGKGSGVLKDGVWRFLKTSSQVKQFQFAPQNLGGRGVTIVELK